MRRGRCTTKVRDHMAARNHRITKGLVEDRAQAEIWIGPPNNCHPAQPRIPRPRLAAGISKARIAGLSIPAAWSPLGRRSESNCIIHCDQPRLRRAHCSLLGAEIQYSACCGVRQLQRSRQCTHPHTWKRTDRRTFKRRLRRILPSRPPCQASIHCAPNAVYQ